MMNHIHICSSKISPTMIADMIPTITDEQRQTLTNTTLQDGRNGWEYVNLFEEDKREWVAKAILSCIEKGMKLRPDTISIEAGHLKYGECIITELTEHQKRDQFFDDAVNALVEMGNCQNQRHLNHKQANIIEAFLAFDGGDRIQLCEEIWNVASPQVNYYWRDGTSDALEELRTRELNHRTYGNGRGL